MSEIFFFTGHQAWGVSEDELPVTLNDQREACVNVCERDTERTCTMSHKQATTLDSRSV